PLFFPVEGRGGLGCAGPRLGVEGLCQKPPAAKEACTRQTYASVVNEAASRLHHPACAAGATCDGTTCQPRVPAGQTCSRSDVCAVGLSCVRGKCGLRGGVRSACAAPADC